MSNLVKGSITDVTRQSEHGLARVMMDIDHIVIVDVSGSMGAFKDSETLYKIACNELRKIQANNPGKYLIIQFSTEVGPALNGEPEYLGQGTNLAAALTYIRRFDNTGVTITIITDGLPDDASAALNAAALFITKINAIYVGLDDSSAIMFLQELTRKTGGKYAQGTVEDIETNVKMLTAGPVSGPIAL